MRKQHDTHDAGIQRQDAGRQRRKAETRYHATSASGLRRGRCVKAGRRGQIVVYDFIFGFITFIIVITFVSLLWAKTTARVAQEMEQDARFRVARDLATIMTQTPGTPTYWEDDVDCINFLKNCTLGLATVPNVLSQTKLDVFIAMNGTVDIGYGGYSGYSGIKQLMNLDEYNFSMAIRIGPTKLYEAGVPTQNNLSATVARKVILDGEIRTFEVTVH